jgi:SNF2 family DNA or RNA helicase
MLTYADGSVSTEERQRRIDRFNDKDAGVFVFLLSLTYAAVCCRMRR